MNSKKSIALFISIFCLAIAFFAHSAEAYTVLNNCRSLNVANEVYQLNASFAQNPSFSEAYCFLISGNNITFDGNGLSLTNPAWNQYSFYINNNNAIIKNVNVASSLTGGSPVVYIASGVSNATIFNSTFYGSTIFRTLNINNLNLESNTIRDCNAYWIYSTGPSINFHLTNSQINCPSSSAGGGRFVDVISNSSFTNNTFTQVKNSLEFVAGGDNIQIYNNTFLNTSNGYGLYAVGLNDSIIADNLFNETGSPDTIYISNSRNVQFLRNTLNTDALLIRNAAFYVADSKNISIINITIAKNNLYNLQVVNTNNFLLQNGLFTQNQISGGEGIHIENVTNGTFTENTLYNVSRFGFYAYGTLNNISFSDNVFRDTSSVSAFNSITLARGAKPNNVNIFKNTWTNWNLSTADAVAVFSGNNVNVFNNNLTVNFTAYYPIEFEYGITNSSVYGNSVNCHRDLMMHSIILRTVDNSEIHDNYIDECVYGIVMHNGSLNSRVYNNVIKNAFGHGMAAVDTSANISYFNNSIYDSADVIFVYHYANRGNLHPENISVYNNYGQNLTYGLWIENASNGYILFKDNVLVNVTTPIRAFFNSTGAVVLNVSYNTSTESVLDTSSITRKWYYRAFVNDTDGNSVPNTNITAFNKMGGYQFDTATDSTGFTPLQQIIDYTNTGGTKTYYSNYTIRATNDSYSNIISHSYNVTSNENNYQDSFTLQPANNAFPQINITYPLNATYNTDVSKLSYVLTTPFFDECWWSNNSEIWNSTKVSAGINFTDIVSKEGSNTWTVYCNDTSNNINSSSITFLVVKKGIFKPVLQNCNSLGSQPGLCTAKI